MKVSVCIAAYNKPKHLLRSLESIYSQPGQREVIVIDDGTPDMSLELVCKQFPEVIYHRLERKGGYRNPAIARNISYRIAQGDVIIAQSDDVEHGSPDTIEKLAEACTDKTFAIAHVYNTDFDGQPVMKPLYEFAKPGRPILFLGAILRKHVYAIGGNDEQFVYPGWEDVWMVDCLRFGLKLQPIFPPGVLGYHLDHPRPNGSGRAHPESTTLYRRLTNLANRGSILWTASSGPWPFLESAQTRALSSID